MDEKQLASLLAVLFTVSFKGRCRMHILQRSVAGVTVYTIINSAEFQYTDML